MAMKRALAALVLTEGLLAANKGQRPHDFAIDGLGLNTGVLQPGEIVSARLTAPGSDVE
jgi:hypothetical protein